MRIDWDKEKREALLALLASSEDAQSTATNEYTVDLYDIDPPISLELAFSADALEVLAACELLFDEEMDGWYLGERVDSIERITSALAAWIG